MRTNHNQYVSTPNWFTSVKNPLEQPSVVSQTVVYGSGGSGGISSLAIHNKSLYGEDKLSILDLSVDKHAVVAESYEGMVIQAGQLMQDDNWSSSLFVPVIGGSEITINTSYDSTLVYGIAFYDIKKQFISGFTTVQSFKQTVLVPEQALYFRVCSKSDYADFKVQYIGLSKYTYKALNELYGGETNSFLDIKDEKTEYINSYNFSSDKISFVADYPLRLEIDAEDNIHFNINELLLGGQFVTTSDEEQDVEGIKYFKKGLGIGDYLIVPDVENNAIKVIHKNELLELEEGQEHTDFGNIYATGWVSALGMSPGGSLSGQGGSNYLYELKDVLTLYNEEGVPYAVEGTEGLEAIGNVLTWNGDNWHATKPTDIVKIFSKLFTAYDENGNVIDITDDEAIIDNISANYNFWSTGYVSALGKSGLNTSATALYSLVDVLKDESSANVQGAEEDAVLTYNGTHWYAKKITTTSGLNETQLKTYLDANEYLTKTGADALFLTQDEGDNRYLLKTIFSKVFTAFDEEGNEVDITSSDSTISNVRINYGLWSNYFISALGKNSNSVSNQSSLYLLTDVLKDETTDTVYGAKKGSVLTYDGTHWYAATIEQSASLDESAVLDILETYEYATKKYVTDQNYLSKTEASDTYLTKTDANNYLLKKIFNKLFTAYDNEGNAIDDITDESAISNIKVNYGLWSDDFISVLGESSATGQSSALYLLSDVLKDDNKDVVKGATAGSVLTYDGTHWIAKTFDFNSGINEADVLKILNDYEYLTKSAATELFLTKEQQSDFLLKSIFKKIFTAYDAENNEIDITDSEAIIDAVKINYGLWSDKFISVHGKSNAGSNGLGALYQLTDVLADDEGTGVKGAKKGAVLTYDGTHWSAGVLDASGGVVDEATIMDVIERYNFITEGEADKRYVLKTIFSKLFTTYDKDGNVVDFDSEDINNVSVNYGFWSKEYLSAKGKFDDLINAMDYIEVDGKTISKEKGYLEVIAEIGGGIDLNDIPTATAGTTSTAEKGLASFDETYFTATSDGFVKFKETFFDDKLSKYVTKEDNQTITGEKDFTGGLKVNGSEIVYNSENGYWKLTGNLVVTGGITMYYDATTIPSSSIMDALQLDSKFFKINDSGQLTFVGNTGGGGINLSDIPTATAGTSEGEGIAKKGLASFNSSNFTVSDAGFVSIKDVAWSKISGKPTFATVATSGKYSDLSGTPTKLSAFTDDVVSGKYLKLSGGTISSSTYAPLTINRSGSSYSAAIKFSNDEDGVVGELGIGGSGFTLGKKPFYSDGEDSYVLLHSGNYTDYTVTKSGTGATGSWAIDITGNSATATKLKTSRTIWGQTFNGTENVSGALTGVTNITATGTLYLGGIGISKSQDGVIYIDGNLAVKGGITMYASGTIDVDSIIKDLPIASTSVKGIASFDSKYFTVTSGKVTLNGDLPSGDSVTELGTKDNYLTWTKGNTVNNITVPYASNASTLNGTSSNYYFKYARGTIESSSINTFATRYSGTYTVSTRDSNNNVTQSGLLTVFNQHEGSASSLELYVSDYQFATSGIKARISIDSNRYSSWRSIAFTDQVLLKTGGTVTGTTTFNANVTIASPSSSPTAYNFIIQRTPSVIQCNGADGTKFGYIGFDSADVPCIYGSTGASSTKQTLIHSGNYGTWCLPKSNTQATYVTSTQTGVLNFKSSNTTAVGIRLYENDNNKGGLWWGSDWGTYVYNATSTKHLGVKNDGTPYYGGPSGTTDVSYTLYHTGNLTPSDYLPKAGGTLTGKLTVAKNYGIYSEGGVLISLVDADNASTWEGLNKINAAGIAISNSAYPSVIRTSGNNFYHYRRDKDNNYLILDSSNYNSYSPTLTGTGASGTWGISVSGNAATATKTYINNSSNDDVFPVIFANRGTCGTPKNDSLHVRTTVGSGYNPSTDTFVATAFSGTNHYATNGYMIYSESTYLRMRLFTESSNNYATGGATFLQAGNFAGTSASGNLYISGINVSDLVLCKVYGPFKATKSIEAEGGYILSNATHFNIRNKSGALKGVMSIDTGNNLCFGYETSAAGYATYIDGNDIFLRTGTGHGACMTLSSSKLVGIGTTSPSEILHIQSGTANTNVYLKTVRSDTGYSARFGVGSGGVNRGIWDDNLNKWLIYSDASNTYLTSNTWINQSGWDNGLHLNRTVAGGGCALRVYSNGTYIGSFGVNGSKQFEVDLNGVSALVVESSGKMSFPKGTNNRYMTIDPASAATCYYGTTTSGWTIGNYFYNNSGTHYGTIGAYGSGTTFSYFFIGSYNGNRLQIDSSGNVFASGGVTMYSDIRRKTKLQDVNLTLEQIANAPLIEYYYNTDEKKTTHVGSVAQYWADINDWFCKLDSDGYYTMEIQNLALASSISVAKELLQFENETDRRIKQLEDENIKLKEKINKLIWQQQHLKM